MGGADDEVGGAGEEMGGADDEVGGADTTQEVFIIRFNKSCILG